LQGCKAGTCCSQACPSQAALAHRTARNMATDAAQCPKAQGKAQGSPSPEHNSDAGNPALAQAAADMWAQTAKQPLGHLQGTVSSHTQTSCRARNSSREPWLHCGIWTARQHATPHEAVCVRGQTKHSAGALYGSASAKQSALHAETRQTQQQQCARSHTLDQTGTGASTAF
jgi:hypothetical protein